MHGPRSRKGPGGRSDAAWVQGPVAPEAAAPGLQDRSQPIGWTQAATSRRACASLTAWKRGSAAPPRDVLPAADTDNTPGSGQSMAAARLVAWGPSQGHWPADHATHWPLLQAHPLLCTEKTKKLQLLGPSRLGCSTGVLAPDSHKVEGPDPSLLHPPSGGVEGGGGPEEKGLVQKRHDIHEAILCINAITMHHVFC